MRRTICWLFIFMASWLGFLWLLVNRNVIGEILGGAAFCYVLMKFCDWITDK